MTMRGLSTKSEQVRRFGLGNIVATASHPSLQRPYGDIKYPVDDFR